MSFFDQYLATAQKAAIETGFLVSVTLAQWADETGYGTSAAFLQGHNYAGVTLPGSQLITGVTAFPNDAAGLATYVNVARQSTYTAVRQAGPTAQAQALALGESPWAGGHYGTPPGSNLVTIIDTYNLTQYDGVGAKVASTGRTTAATAAAAFRKAYPTLASEPPVGFSTAADDQILIQGQTLRVLVGSALVTIEQTLAITKIGTITLTLNDPTRTILPNPVFQQASYLRFGPHLYQLFGIGKSGSVLTCTFIPWVVAALKKQTGAFTVAPETMTRTDFAKMLVTQVAGATFSSATASWLYAQDTGYAHTNKEQLSRGTQANPLEDSWTCLQRLANEIQWVCFESFGTVYFGPYAYLAQQLPVLSPREFQQGVSTIDGTYTVGQPLGELKVECVAGAWTPAPGQCVAIENMGPFDGNWIVSGMSRPDLLEPTITVTLMQPLPGLPEPTRGGTLPAVGTGAGNAQSTGSKTAAAQAVKFALAQVGKRYSETGGARLGPTSFDCSGLVYEAYASAGVDIGGPNHTTYTMWPSGAGTQVPAGITNLLPGDLVFFGDTPGGTAVHVAMVVKVNKAAGTVEVVQAADPAQGIITTTGFVPTIGSMYGPEYYLGALRPAA